MATRFDENTEALLAQYLKDVRSLANEAAKTARFIGLIGSLFRGSAIVTQLSGGIEKAVHIELPDRTKHGRIDSYFGNCVIEFEQSLRATGAAAEVQLKEYCSAVWAKEKYPFRPLIAIATDGIVWKTYRPSLPPGFRTVPHPADVALASLREFTLSDSKLPEFYIWLNGLLFRTGQIVPSAEQFKQDFGKESLAYGDAIAVLAFAWDRSRKEPESALAFQNWQRYLTVTYGSLPTKQGQEVGQLSELEELFLKHTYLASVARLMIWASLSHGKTNNSYSDVARDVFSGDYFRARRLANIVDDDFFQWTRAAQSQAELTPVWEKIIAQIETYDLNRLDQDVLKGVYQELVDPKDRHDLGEYYTPDWLCERVVSELLPTQGYVSVLDPTCGSGGFLRASITYFLNADPASPDDTRLQSVLEHVVGMDVHPLAVTIAKATYVLALGAVIRAAKQPIQIPVYLADSLFLPTEITQFRFGQTPGFEVRFGGKKIVMPEDFVRSQDLFDSCIAAASTIAVDHAKTSKESAVSLEAYLLKEFPALEAHAERADIVASLWEYVVALADLITKKKNSIWAFIIRNSYRPAMLRKQFDVLVGNPPWLSYRYIADPEYQDEIKKRAVDEYRIAPREHKLFTQMELATVFVAHSMGWFGKPGSKLGFVMPRSILSADQHNNLRSRSYSWRCSFRISGYWDLKDVQPLFNVPSCVLFADHADEFGKPDDPVPAREWAGTLPSRDLSWAAASGSLSSQPKEAHFLYLGDHTAFSTGFGNLKPVKGSAYAGKFRQGATILPRNMFFVRMKDSVDDIEPDSLYWVETDPEQAKEAKEPYQDVYISGNVEGRFLFGTALSRHVMPFVVLTPAPIVLPVLINDNRLTMAEAATLKRKGFRKIAVWMEKAEKIWKDKRGQKAGVQTIYEWLDYQGKLTAQALDGESIVLYNAAGTNVCAGSYNRADFPLPFVVEHKAVLDNYRDEGGRRLLGCCPQFRGSERGHQTVPEHGSNGRARY